MNAKMFLMSVLALLSCSACGELTPPDPDDSTPYFKTEIQDLYIQGPDDTGFHFIVDTNLKPDEWTVTGDADWITITNDGREVIIVPNHIEHDQNYYPAPRSCTVSVKAGSLFEKTFTIVQEAWTRLSSVYQVQLKPGGETVELSVDHNCYSWTPRTDATWLTVSRKNTATVVITSSPRAASDTKSRSAVVRLQSDANMDTYWNITVSDADSALDNGDYNYGGHTDWD